MPFTRSLLTLAIAILASTSSLAADPMLTISDSQRKALGLRSVPARQAGPDLGAAPLRANGRAVLPPAAQRVIAVPLPALVEQLHFAPGDTVRAGTVMARLRSVQAHELGHELEASHQLLKQVRASLARDEQLGAEGLIPRSRLDASRAAVAQAELQHEGRLTAMSMAGGEPDGRILARSPITGTVLEQLVQVGQRLDGNTALYRVAPLGMVWIELSLPVADADRLQPGDRVRLPGRCGEAQLLGTAGTVDPATQLVTLRARYAGTQPPRPGQWLEVEILRRQDGLSQIPSSALSELNGKPLVFVEESGGRYRALTLQSAHRQGTLAAVAGLPSGARVVSEGTAALRSLLDDQKS